MAGILGKITKAKGRGGKEPKTVYLSNKVRLYMEGNFLHLTLDTGGHKGISEEDGIIYYLLKALYDKGMDYPEQ